MEAGVLGIQPADEPHVDVNVAVKLSEVALVRVVAYQVTPQARCTAESDGELGQL